MATFWSLGTGNRSIEEFLDLLKDAGISVVVDVRRFPTSTFEHFKSTSLKASVASQGMEYVHLVELGGYRGDYLQHMKGAGFRGDFEKLESFGKETPTTFFCAEKDFRGCHRRFIADVLVSRGHTVLHILDRGKYVEHVAQHALDEFKE